MPRLRRISAVRKEDLLLRAKALRSSVDPLLPALTRDAPPDRFDRLRVELEEVRESRDDEDRLERLARRGDPLARAYAGLLRFSLKPEAIAVVTFPLPSGDIPFAPLARTDPATEVAVQHSDEPARLLLGYVEWARRGFHFFATDDKLWCTGRSAEPPPSVLSAKVMEIPYRLVEDPTSHRRICPHLASHEARPFLEVEWPGARTGFRVCDRCAKPDRHLLGSLTDGIATPDPSAEFPVRADFNVRCKAGASCVHSRLPDLPRGVRQSYERGRLADSELLHEYLSEVRARLDRVTERTLVVNGVCFGGNVDGFLDELKPTATERRVLEQVLKETSGYFSIDRATSGQALEQLWPTHFETIVHTIVEDPRESRRLIEELRGAPPGRVAELLKRVQRVREERDVMESLPKYQSLTPVAAYVDRVARAYRTQGGEGAARIALESLPQEGNGRSLAFALLLALGQSDPHVWRFSETEQKSGHFLVEAARSLLNGSPQDYHSALDRLLVSAGVAGWGVRQSA